jgi:hypothetical protein
VTADAPSYAKDSTGPPEAPTIGVTFFKCRTDTAPWQREMVLSDFILQLSHHNERVPKDGSMFACVTYRAGETRSNAGIEHATAIVLDVDTGGYRAVLVAARALPLRHVYLPQPRNDEAPSVAPRALPSGADRGK